MRGRNKLPGYLSIAAALAAGGLGGRDFLGSMPPTVRGQDRGTCSLPGCGNPANRGGYCCAEHCKQHREMDREKRGFGKK